MNRSTRNIKNIRELLLESVDLDAYTSSLDGQTQWSELLRPRIPPDQLFTDLEIVKPFRWRT